jgi:vacuolar-type H+-ATPase subunit E/Vma4
MSIKTIEKNLTKALLNDGEMKHELYEWEVEEHLEDFKKSMQRDNDEFLFVVTENNNEVAMVLIEKTGEIHINEKAREKLKEIWSDNYQKNLLFLIPQFAEDLQSGNLAVNGVKYSEKRSSDQFSQI